MKVGPGQSVSIDLQPHFNRPVGERDVCFHCFIQLILVFVAAFTVS